MQKCQISPEKKLAASLALLLYAAACGDPEVGTLVRFQGNGSKPSAAWNLEVASDAGTDAAADSGEPAAADAGTPDASTPDPDEEAEDAGAPEAKAAKACTFKLTTRAQGGRYAPKNIGAIWIERDDGTWVKTLKVWAGVRLRYLTTYLAANTKRDTTDAMTSATLRQHVSHEVTWDLGDSEPDGDYRVRVEVTDRSSEGQLLSVPFSKSGAAVTVSPDDSEFFVDVSLDCS